MPSEKPPPRIEIIQDAIDRRLWLRVHCKSCSKSTEIPHGLIASMVSGRLSLSEAEPKFKCTSCGETQAKLSVTDPLDNW